MSDVRQRKPDKSKEAEPPDEIKRAANADDKTSRKKQRSFVCSKLSFGVIGAIVIAVLALAIIISLVTYFIVFKTKPPHILLLLADDLGWGDVGWHSSEIKTPTLSRLARDGVIFSHFYTQPICTASRAALLTGRYPFKLGLQGSRPILAGTRSSLPLGEYLISQELKSSGYRTHLIGKWHLGFEAVEYTPVARGFDTFTGFYNGMQDYFYHKTSGFDTINNVGGYDMRRDTMDKNGVPQVDNILWDANGTYNTFIFTDEATRIIREHAADYKNNPLFLMMSYANPHTPIQVPEKFIESNSHIKNKIRRKYAGLISAMDDSVKQILDALEAANLIDDTLILFLSDNGGAYVGHRVATPTGSTNFPLRGIKGTLWEGGNRVPAFITGPGVPKNKMVNDVVHITDVYPSLMKMLDITLSVNNIDGMDLSHHFRGDDSPIKKDYIIYDIDPVYKVAGIRKGKWKLILGKSSLRNLDQWYPPLVGNETTSKIPIMNITEFLKVVNQSIVAFKEKSDFCKTTTCLFPKNVNEQVQVFDLEKDEYEFNDVSSQHPEVIEELINILNLEMQSMVAPVNLLDPGDANASPANFNGAWQPWMKIP